MLKTFDQRLIQQCCHIFQEHLGEIDDKDIPNIASYMVIGKSPVTLDHILSQWVKNERSLEQLLQTINACQNTVIQAYIPKWFQQDTPPYQHMSLHLERFHHISMTLVSTYKQAFEQQEKIDTLSPSQKLEQAILSSFNTQWQQQEKLTCLNYYKGLPVQCSTTIKKIHKHDHDDYITVSLSRALLRVLAVTEQTSILIFNQEHQKLIQLDTHHITQNDVTFTTNNMSLLQKRQQLRLQPTSPMEAIILQHKKIIGGGEIIDLSIKHIHIRMASHLCQHFRLKNMVDIQIQLSEHFVKGSAWIRSMRPNPPHHILQLEFLPSAKVQRHLQTEVAALQRKIIQQIKEKFAAVF